MLAEFPEIYTIAPDTPDEQALALPFVKRPDSRIGKSVSRFPRRYPKFECQEFDEGYVLSFVPLLQTSNFLVLPSLSWKDYLAFDFQK